jgi:DNA-binding PadR family transcriptional regulator
MSVRDGILALLTDGPRHGYQIKTAFESATGGVWSLNVGQVYTTLDRLHRDGLVDIDDGGGQKRYSLTAGGREALGAWWSAVPTEEPPPRDALLLKVLLAVDQGPEQAIEVLTRHRTALIGLLQQRRRSLASGATGDLAAALVHDALVVRAEADLRWLDLCEARLLRSSTSAGRSGG